MLKLTDGDKEYIKLTQDGERPSSAFRIAYPDHFAVKLWHETQPGTPDRQKAAEILKDAAKGKLQAKYIKAALATYTDKMEQFSQLSLEAATDLVVNARSEKVRADLAIEGIRHKIGSPTVKVQSQESKVVYLTFGSPPENLPPVRTVIDVDDGDEVDALDEPTDS